MVTVILGLSGLSCEERTDRLSEACERWAATSGVWSYKWRSGHLPGTPLPFLRAVCAAPCSRGGHCCELCCVILDSKGGQPAAGSVERDCGRAALDTPSCFLIRPLGDRVLFPSTGLVLRLAEKVPERFSWKLVPKSQLPASWKQPGFAVNGLFPEAAWCGHSSSSPRSSLLCDLERRRPLSPIRTTGGDHPVPPAHLTDSGKAYPRSCKLRDLK